MSCGPFHGGEQFQKTMTISTLYLPRNFSLTPVGNFFELLTILVTSVVV